MILITLIAVFFSLVNSAIVSQKESNREGNNYDIGENSSGYIMSHEGFNFGINSKTHYQVGHNYTLTLRTTVLSVAIKLKYISFFLGLERVCEADAAKLFISLSLFTIKNGEIPLYACAGGGSKPGETEFHLKSRQNSVQFRLLTRNAAEGFGGYLIHYESKYITSSCVI